MKASEELIDTKDEEIKIETSMVLDNIENQEFDIDSWNYGIEYISKYCAIYTGFRNVGISENNCIELMKEIIRKEE